MPFERASATITVNYGGDRVEKVRAVPRDISRGGIMVMHEKAVTAGTSCLIELAPLKTRKTSVQGIVTHCQRIGLPLYRVGIRFADELSESDLRSIVDVT